MICAIFREKFAAANRKYTSTDKLSGSKDMDTLEFLEDYTKYSNELK